MRLLRGSFPSHRRTLDDEDTVSAFLGIFGQTKYGDELLGRAAVALIESGNPFPSVAALVAEYRKLAAVEAESRRWAETDRMLGAGSEWEPTDEDRARLREAIRRIGTPPADDGPAPMRNDADFDDRKRRALAGLVGIPA